MKTYSGVIILSLNAASYPARRTVSRMIFVALPPFILDDPLMASAYRETRGSSTTTTASLLLMTGGRSLNSSKNIDIYCLCVHVNNYVNVISQTPNTGFSTYAFLCLCSAAILSATSLKWNEQSCIGSLL